MAIIIGDSTGEVLTGTNNSDLILGRGGNDTLSGLDGRDTLRGGRGYDTITGGNGNDILRGGSGNDIINGNAGNDRLIGGAGNDILTGGLGADKFVFRSTSLGEIDIITDFNKAEGDKIIISKEGFGATSLNDFSYNSANGALSFKGTPFATIQNNPLGFSTSLNIQFGTDS